MSTKKKQKQTKNQIKKEVKKDVAVQARKQDPPAPKRRKAVTGMVRSPNADPFESLRTPRHACPSDVGCLAVANGYVAHEGPTVTPPPILGVGETQGEAKTFTFPGSFVFECNDQGFGFALFEATGWVPDPTKELDEPANALIGGVQNVFPSDTPAMCRGPVAYWSDHTYAGVINPPVGPKQVPAQGTPLIDTTNWTVLGPTAPNSVGVNCQLLPANFVPFQDEVEADNIQSGQDRQTFQLTKLTATCEPDGFYVDPAFLPVQVVSGELMGYSWVGGDNLSQLPNNPINIASGSTSFDWVADLPLSPPIIAKTIQSVVEWPKDHKMHVHAVPCTSTALGQWPASILSQPAGTLISTVTSETVAPFIGFIAQGCKPGQTFRVSYKYGVAGWGVNTYEDNRSVMNHHPVNSDQMADILGRTMPQQATPQLVKTGKSSTNGVRAFAQSARETGTSTSSIVPIVKAAAGVADSALGTSIGSVLEDIGMGLAAIFL